MRHFFCDIIAVVMALTVVQCRDENDPEPGNKTMDTVICINVGMLDIPGGMRADSYGFENAATDYEKVHTLRMIIVRPDGKVEHNRFLNYENPIEKTSEIFKVVGNEAKDVYLFANELSDKWKNNGYYDFSTIKKGDIFPKKDIEALTISADESGILFDNSGETKTCIPINEHFTFKLESDEPGSPEEPSETFNCFITRAAVKFTFSIDSSSEVESNEFSIINIKINKVGDMEYLLPNNTDYKPMKYQENNTPPKGRVITSYKLPQDALANSYMFEPVGFGKGGVGQNSRVSAYSPLKYFAESKGGEPGYIVELKVKRDDGEIFDFGPAKLSNLSDCPRNTHVKINFKFNSYGIVCTTTLVPYIGVWLYPTFGIDTDKQQE